MIITFISIIVCWLQFGISNLFNLLIIKSPNSYEMVLLMICFDIVSIGTLHTPFSYTSGETTTSRRMVALYQAADATTFRVHGGCDGVYLAINVPDSFAEFKCVHLAFPISAFAFVCTS
ncbi:hypothetical protein Hanom_Chr05g00442901 [Helianthus anomalus]